MLLGRTSARVLRSTPQHIRLPCLRRQLLQPVAARCSSLGALRTALLHTTAAARDQAHAESSNPPPNESSPSAPEPNNSEPSTEIAGEAKPSGKTSTTRAARRKQNKLAKKEKLKKGKRVRKALNHEKDQSSGEVTSYSAGQLENHATLSEALLHQAEKTELETEKHMSSIQLRRVPVKESMNWPRRAKTNSQEKKKKKEKKTPGREEKKKTPGKEEKPKQKTKRLAELEAEEESHRADLANATEYESLSAQELHLTPLDVSQPPVPSLAYGLDRALFNPGVYQLQDPRTQVFNFDPYLSNVMPVAEFNFNSLGEYITSSRDTALSELARKHQKTFVGSTSSMTASLSHFHYLLSCWRPINDSLLSKGFPDKHTDFTKLNRLPASVFLRYKNGVYSIDADKEFDQSNILAMLGKSMEKLLTLPTEEYERYRLSNPNQISEEERQQPESYHYTSMGDMLMRSQLDAHDSRLPGTGMYDLKTRAVVSIRMDVHEWDKNTGYQIKSKLGKFESYEREYYDMMRSVLLKYSLQARMGRMDGIFVAYHNIERIFGFQYISIEDMDRAIHGTEGGGRDLGDQEFRLSVGLLNKILRQATERFPETSLRVQFETRESKESPWMYIFAEPMSEDEIQTIQDTNKAQIQAFERRVLGLDSEDSAEGEALENALTEEARGYGEGAFDDVVEDDATETAAGERGELVDGATSAEAGENTASEEEIAKDEAASDDAAPERETPVAEDTMLGITEGAAHGELSPAEDTVPGADAKDEVSADDLVAEDQVVQEPGENTASEEEIAKDEAASDDAAPERETPVAEDTMLGITEGAAHGELSPAEDTVPGAAAKDEVSADDLVAEDQVVQENAKQEDAAEEQNVKDHGASKAADRPLLAMKLFVTNRVDGEPVTRPENLSEGSNWTIDYTMKEIENSEKARALFKACRKRRAQGFSASVLDAKGDKVLTFYQQLLRQISAKGRAWREERDQELERHGKVVYEPRHQRLVDLDMYLSWLYSQRPKGRSG